MNRRTLTLSAVVKNHAPCYKDAAERNTILCAHAQILSLCSSAKSKTLCVSSMTYIQCEFHIQLSTVPAGHERHMQNEATSCELCLFWWFGLFLYHW